MSVAPIEPIFCLTKSGLFAARGGEKVLGGDVMRIIPTAGQGLNFLKAVANLNESVGKNCSTAVDAFDTAKKSTLNRISEGVAKFEKTAAKKTFLGYTAKGVDIVSKNINPVLGGVTAFNILTAENKEKAVLTQGTGFLAMLGAEKAFKTGAALLKIGLKVGSMDPKVRLAVNIAEGVLFAATSIGAWITASKIGAKIYDSRHKDIAVNEKAVLENAAPEKDSAEEKAAVPAENVQAAKAHEAETLLKNAQSQQDSTT